MTKIPYTSKINNKNLNDLPQSKCMNNPYSVKITKELKDKLKRQAFIEGIPIYQLLDKVLKEYIKKHKY